MTQEPVKELPVMEVKQEKAVEVFTRYITLKSGKRIYASQYGLKAFRFLK